MIKTGECLWRDEIGNLWLAESYATASGEVHTEQTLVEAAPVDPAG